MSDTEILQVVAQIGFVSSILDAVLPPTEIPGLKQARKLISILAVNIGHSHNVAPSEAAKEATK